MALTWSRRARRRKEIKRASLQEEKNRLLEIRAGEEASLTAVQEELEKETAHLAEAEKRETAAVALIARGTEGGRQPIGAHVAVKEAVGKEIEAAMSKVQDLTFELRLSQSKLTEVPKVPDIDDISLTAQDVATVAMFVLVDLLKFEAWVAALIVAGGAGVWYALAEYGVLEKLGF